MKRSIFILSLAVICLLLALSACSDNSAGGFTGVDHSTIIPIRPAETPCDTMQTPDPTTTAEPTQPTAEASGDWTYIIPVYDDGELIVDVNGGVVGISVLKTSESYFKGYVNTLKGSGWEVEETPGANNFYMAGKGNWVVSLICTGNAAAIFLCSLVD